MTMLRGVASLPLLGALLVLGLGCGSTRITGDRVDTLNQTLAIAPLAAAAIPGHAIQFQATIPWGGGSALWSVVPASAGTITAGGLFIAAAADTPGQTCTVRAGWSKDVRYTASTSVAILAPPAPGEGQAPVATSPNTVEANGTQQTVPGTTISNGAVVGEAVPATVSTSANGLIQNRGDLLPPGPTPSN